MHRGGSGVAGGRDGGMRAGADAFGGCRIAAVLCRAAGMLRAVPGPAAGRGVACCGTVLGVAEAAAAGGC